MARSKSGALGALKKLRDEQDKLAAREAELKADAANELGKVMLDCGAEAIEPAQLRRLMSSVRQLGIEESFKRLASTSKAA